MVIGLTGGIACGKSVVADLLESLGADIIDTDDISREVTGPGSPVLKEIVKAWGAEVLAPDGSLDRKRLAGWIFDDPEATAKLNQITHPAILAEMKRRMAGSSADVVVVVVPLLYESGADKIVDEVWVVWAKEAVQTERLVRRDGLDEDEAKVRIASQMPVAAKVARAPVAIENNGSRVDVRNRVLEAWKKLQSRLAARG